MIEENCWFVFDWAAGWPAQGNVLSWVMKERNENISAEAAQQHNNSINQINSTNEVCWLMIDEFVALAAVAAASLRSISSINFHFKNERVDLMDWLAHPPPLQASLIKLFHNLIHSAYGPGRQRRQQPTFFIQLILKSWNEKKVWFAEWRAAKQFASSINQKLKF